MLVCRELEALNVIMLHLTHTRRWAALAGPAAALAAAAALLPAPATASTTAGPAYTVTVNGTGPWNPQNDTPSNPFIDANGQFYYQDSASSYAGGDPREWMFYTGADFDTATPDAVLDNAVNPANPADSNADTTWRCNNSPTGLESTYAPAGSSYAERNYCDLNGVWVDPDTGDWYGIVHNEFTPQPFADGLHYDAIDFAESTDKGKTWTIKGHILTSPYSTKRGDTTAFPQQTYYWGDGDPRLYVDTASGYFYVFYGSRVVDKGGSWKAFYGHVARAPISGKMATGTWRKWYAGTWSQPGIGGKESNMTPVTASDPTGYTDPAKEYNPDTPGTTSQQVAAGETPPTSPLFVMDITYDAYLGEYIGEPQNPDQSGNAPQQYYATDNLATQRWRLIGDTGSYHTASWYRWFLDSANRTSSNIVGKAFRAYCSYGCSSSNWYGEYANVTIGTTAASAPVRSGGTYRIASGDGGVLAQVPGGTGVTSAAHPSDLSRWTFTATGDGSYTIANAKTGQVLGVDSGAVGGRAWGAKPTASGLAAGTPSTGQEWFVIRDTSARNGTPTGTYRLVNRYSGLVLGLSPAAAETTPARSWNDTSSSHADTMRGTAEQTLTLVPAP